MNIFIMHFVVSLFIINIGHINYALNLLDCIPYNENGTPEDQIRKAMKLAKNRIFKKHSK